MSDYHGVGGYFIDSGFGGTDPHVHEIHTLLPNGPAPHIWETPPQPSLFAQEAQSLQRWALLDAEWARTDAAIAAAGPLTGPRVYNLDGLQGHWDSLHPVRAWLIRLGFRSLEPSGPDLVRTWLS